MPQHITENETLPGRSPTALSAHLARLEAESIYILREAAAEFERPTILYSIGKDSSVLLHLAIKAFSPCRMPFSLLHVDTTWKFRDMIAFRDATAARLGLDLVVHINEDGVKEGVSPIASGSALHTHVMKTLALKQALDRHGIDAAIGGARRDEEKSRAKERVFSLRSAGHGWNPRAQRPELWSVFNTRLGPGESMRVFPLSDWTELDVWEYIAAENIPVVPLYFAAERPVVERNGTWIMVDDDRLPLEPGEQPQMRRIRFRTLGCYPLSGGIESDALTVEDIIAELRSSRFSERQGRLIDHDERGVNGAEEERGVLLMHGATPLRQKSLLRFFMGGSVDDGKSTLIGRLLHETGSVAEDELAALTRDSARFGNSGQAIDFALLVDGLEDEREQGITIDVAHRYFSSPRRAFIVADTPGHESYTRNTASGASNADLAIILVDARRGLLPQTRRHAMIAHMVGVRHFVLAVNKLDLVNWDRAVYDRIVEGFRDFANPLNFASLVPIPLSALNGDNVSAKGDNTPWYDGPSLLGHLETVDVESDQSANAAARARPKRAAARSRQPALRRLRRRRHIAPGRSRAGGALRRQCQN